MRNLNISFLALLAIVGCYTTLLIPFRSEQSDVELAIQPARYEIIDVPNDNRIALRRLPPSEPFVSRWAVRLPNPKEKRLYASWGSASLDELRGPNDVGVRCFDLAPDSETGETLVELSFVRNPNDSSWGSVVIVISSNTSHHILDMTINPEIASLLMADNATTAVSNSPTKRSSEASLTLYSVESTAGVEASFCLWIDNAESHSGG